LQTKKKLEEEATSKGTELLWWQSPTLSVAKFYLNPNSKNNNKTEHHSIFGKQSQKNPESKREMSIQIHDGGFCCCRQKKPKGGGNKERN
jgi:hypothetical protein